MKDLKSAIRQQLKNPGIQRSMRIGANAAIFIGVHGVLLKPQAYREPDRLVTIFHEGRNPVDPRNFLNWRRRNQSQVGMAAAEAWSGILIGANQPETVLRFGSAMDNSTDWFATDLADPALGVCISKVLRSL